MAKQTYTIEMNYVVAYTTQVEIEVTGNADDEGKALQAARTKAEDADMDEFSIVRELEARIVDRR